jgi:hypothetical protein
MPPYVLDPLFEKCEELTFEEEILYDDVPYEVIAKMSKIPYVLQSWDENGMEIDQFNQHPATIATAETFSKASAGLESYVKERLEAVTGK